MNFSTDIKKQNQREVYEILGSVLLIERQKQVYHGRAMGWLEFWLTPNTMFDQIKIIYSEQGSPIGFICWAFFEQDVLHKIATSEAPAIHISEWSEGKIPWIIDFVTVSSDPKAVFEFACEQFFKQHAELGIIRRSSNEEGVSSKVRRLSKIRNRVFEATL